MINFLKFLTFLFFAVFLPGKLILSWLKLKLTKFEDFILSLSLGIVILTLLSFIFGWLGLKRLLYPVLFFVTLLAFKKKHFLIFKKPLKIDWFLAFLLFLATLFQSLVMIKSGTPHQGGVALWGVHGHDGIWHATLIQELAQEFPGENPGFAGNTLQNYHYFFDLFAAEIYRLTKIPILDLYFRFCPLFLAFLFNSLVFNFAYRWSGKKSVGIWSVFFCAFASSFGFLLPFLGIGSPNWETAFWAMQTSTSLQNPPFFISLILLLEGLLLFLFYEKEKKVKGRFLIILSLIFGSVIEFKVYGGLVVVVSLLTLGFWRLIFKKQAWVLKLALFSLSVSFLVYLPSSKGSTGFVEWQPFWFVRTMIQAGDRMNWVVWELRRQVYVAYRNWFGVLVVDGVALGLFLVGNLGTRILGFLALPKKLFKPKTTNLFLFLIFLVGFLPPLLFIQKYLPWNTIQFFYYSIFIFSFFAALGIDFWIKKAKTLFLRAVLIMGIIALSLPGSLKTISWHWGKTPTSILDRNEKEALVFVKKNSQRKDVVLVYPYSPGAEVKFLPPVPLSHYNAAYVSFFANRRVYLEDQTAALIQGYGFEERYQGVKKFFETPDASWANKFLDENQIGFVYLVDKQKWQADLENKLGLVFKNQRARVYQVVRD